MNQQMTAVQISPEGIVKNISSLNYNHETTMREYLNNILDKNRTNPYYQVQFNMKTMGRNLFMFECVERNACGFESFEELQRAFRIADSERSGTNNMGYGIFSPITINRDHEAYGLFLQHNQYGSFYSIVYFTAKYSKIWTHQGVIVDGHVLGKDLTQYIVEGGNRFIWITRPDNTITEDELNLDIHDILKRITVSYNLSVDKDVIEGDILDDFNKLGAYYLEFLTGPDARNIFYGVHQLQPINFLMKDNGEMGVPRSYTIGIDRDDATGVTRNIVRDDAGVWRSLTLQPAKPIGETEIESSGVIQQRQTAVLKVYDIDEPVDTRQDLRKQRTSYRKVWVKLNDTFIFSEDFSMNGWPNSRIVLELENKGENDFNSFISPDPNKSNSSINPKLKAYLVCLIRKTLNTHFSTETTQRVTPTVKHEVWETVMGNVCRGICTNPTCSNELTAWKYDVIRVDPELDNTVDNLTPICKACVR